MVGLTRLPALEGSVASVLGVRGAPPASVDAALTRRQGAAAVPSVLEPLAPVVLVLAQEAPTTHPRPSAASVQLRGLLKEPTQGCDACTAPTSRATPSRAVADARGPLLAATASLPAC